MLTIDVPGFGLLELEYLVLDVNGTLVMDGEVPVGVDLTLETLARSLNVVAVTADTHQNASELLAPLALDIRVVGRGSEAEAKLDVVDELGGGRVVAIGNGANDELMLRDAALGIAVIGQEGASAATVAAADIVVTGIEAALQMLVEPRRIIATLRR